MRHVFIVNPAAGKKQQAMELEPLIRAYFDTHEGEYAIRVTTAPGDARDFAREEAESGKPVRVYACGGDGTLHEVAVGLSGYDNAEITVVPCGSGNDYIRSFGTKEDFLDLPRLIEGEVRTVDAIRADDDISINICSMGLDADVAVKMVKFKHWPLVSGSMAYNLAVVSVLLHPIGEQLKLRLTLGDGSVVEREGRYLFALAASGRYYGGGYHGAPEAIPDDGLLDLVLVKAVSTLKAVTLVGGYKRGEHLGWDICEFVRGTKMEVIPQRPASITVDGECTLSEGTTFEILPAHYRFVVPRKAEA